MRERRTTQKTALAAVAALLPTASGFILPSLASGQPAGEPDGSEGDLPGRGASDGQAERYSLDYDVDVEEARRRLAAQDELVTALSELRELAGERFAAMWIEHEPRFRGVVRLTGPVVDEQAFDAVIDESPVPIDLRTDGRFSASELADEQAKIQDALADLVPGASTSTDPRSESVAAYLPGEDAGDLGGSLGTDPAATLQALTAAPVTVRYDPEPAREHQMYGGDWIGFSSLPLCTTGFSVLYFPPEGGDPIEGVLTAAHCDNAGSMSSVPTYEGDLYLYEGIEEVYDSQADIAVHRALELGTSVPASASPEFYGVSQDPMDRTTAMGFTARLDQMVGTFVWHQGAMTGYSCGEIVANDSTECLPGEPPCDPVWVRVEGENLACFGGDSGGPWFVGSTAYGIHKGGTEMGTGPGDCSHATYTAIDKKVQVNSVLLQG